MTFDVGDFLLILNPGTLLVGMALGVIVGALYFGDRRRATPYIIGLAAIGAAFVVSIGLIRMLQHSPGWEVWLAVLCLWLLYSAAITVGSWVHGLLQRP